MPRPKSDSLRPRRVTMQDIADAAGVHLMTVSNALGSTRSVAPETRERVLRIARELNYVPNLLARSLVAGRAGTIAIATGDIREPYYGRIVHRLKEHMDSDGYNLRLLYKPHEIVDLINATSNATVDAVIAVDLFPSHEGFDWPPLVPIVALGTYRRENLDYVIVDLSPAVERALEIMWQQGRKRLAYVVNTAFLAEPEEVRAHTYLEFMARVGRPTEIINADTNQFPVVRARVKQYFEEHGCPDGLLCLNDEIAMCTFRALRDLGVRVPEDVLLVGCDGHIHMEYFDPPLSTIEQPVEEMCDLGWQFLVQRMRTPQLPQQMAVVPATLLTRESLGKVL